VWPLIQAFDGQLVGGLEQCSCLHILGRIIPTD